MNPVICHVVKYDKFPSLEILKLILRGAHELYSEKAGNRVRKLMVEGEIEVMVVSKGEYERYENISGIVFNARIEQGCEIGRIIVVVSKTEFLCSSKEDLERHLKTLRWREQKSESSEKKE